MYKVMEDNELVIEAGNVTKLLYEVAKKSGSLTLREEQKLQIFVSSML